MQARIAGIIISRDAPPHETIRQSLVWNARKPARYPDAIVRVASERDVQEAVRFARANNLKIAVRGSGHN